MSADTLCHSTRETLSIPITQGIRSLFRCQWLILQNGPLGRIVKERDVPLQSHGMVFKVRGYKHLVIVRHQNLSNTFTFVVLRTLVIDTSMMNDSAYSDNKGGRHWVPIKWLFSFCELKALSEVSPNHFWQGKLLGHYLWNSLGLENCTLLLILEGTSIHCEKIFIKESIFCLSCKLKASLFPLMLGTWDKQDRGMTY